MTLLQHYQLSLILTTAVTTTFGLWVFLRQRKSKVAQIFCLYSLAVSFWSWCQAQIGISSNPAVSLAWVRAMFFVAVAFPVLLTHFFSEFLQINQRKVCLLGWILVLGFSPFLLSDSFLRQGGPVGFLSSMPRAGPLFLPFNLVWIGWILYDLYLFARRPSSITQPGQKQVNLLFTSFVFGYLTGCTNYLYLYGVCIPPLQPLACYGAPISFLVIAYGVFAYGLFDIQIVIRKSLAYSLLVTALTVGYFGFIYGVERFFQIQLGYRSDWSIVAFALMALFFQPLKIGIQRGVDWLIFRVPQEELVKRMERLEEQALQVEKFKAVSTLAAGMAHEIRNPLTALKTFTEYIPEKSHDPEFLKKLHEVFSREVDRITKITRELLEFAKPKPPNLTPVDVEPLVNSTINLLSGDLLKHQVQWTVNCRHNGAIIRAHRGTIRVESLPSRGATFTVRLPL